MDGESESRLYKTLSEFKGKRTIIIVTHDPEFVSPLTDYVLCLGEGLKNTQARTVVLHKTEFVSDTTKYSLLMESLVEFCIMKRSQTPVAVRIKMTVLNFY